MHEAKFLAVNPGHADGVFDSQAERSVRNRQKLWALPSTVS